MPQPMKPTALKVLTGTVRKDRANPDEPQYEVSEGMGPPPWLRDGTAVAVWNELAGILEGHRVLTVADRHALAQLCNLESAAQAVWRSGETPNNAMLNQIRMFLQEFGLTPASRPKVSGAGPAKSANPFAELVR